MPLISTNYQYTYAPFVGNKNKKTHESQKGMIKSAWVGGEDSQSNLQHENKTE